MFIISTKIKMFLRQYVTVDVQASCKVSVADPEWVQTETKLFHFHGIFKKNEIKSAKRTPHLYTYEGAQGQSA